MRGVLSEIFWQDVLMSKIYTPGPEADAIVERQLAKGSYAAPTRLSAPVCSSWKRTNRSWRSCGG
jgi:hypothetical protein